MPTPALRTGRWSEQQARELLADAGVPVVPAWVVGSADEAAKAAAGFGGPVALKVVSAGIVHKSDVGGVRLNVRGEDAVRAAYASVVEAVTAVPGARCDGVLVSPMRAGGVELLVGVVRDPQWGPVLAVALGGVLVEELQDSVLARVPVTPERVGELLGSLRGAAVLDGVRGADPVDTRRLAAVVSRIGDLAVALGEDLESLEVNPLRVDGATIEALDAVVTWREK